jgi:hypothetical protein
MGNGQRPGILSTWLGGSGLLIPPVTIQADAESRRSRSAQQLGWPTLEELRRDVRAIMQGRADYPYEAYDTPELRRVRIPREKWAGSTPSLGASGLSVRQGGLPRAGA